MENNDLFNFVLNEDDDYWIVTGYHGNAEKMVLPQSYKGKLVKKIGKEFSLGNKRIKSVIIPEGYISIGEWAFSNPKETQEEYYEESIYGGSKWLKKIEFPESLISIEDYAFCGCKELKEIIFPKNLISFGKYTFNECIGLTKIKLPNNLTFIEESVFSGCKKLTKIKFPEGLVSIGAYAFSYCTGLAQIIFPESLISIGENAFEYCTRLAQISVNKNNPVFCTIDGVLFDKAMTALLKFPPGKKGKFSVPEGIIKIKDTAFDDCKEITSISFPQSLLLIGDFNSNDELRELRFDCEQLEEITVNRFNTVYYSIDGVLLYKETNDLLVYPRNKGKAHYAVPDGIHYIYPFAFDRCKYLVNITFPESLKFIDKMAFFECEELKTITLPMNLEYIAEGAFINCPNIETITLSRKTKNINKAFEGFKGQFIYMEDEEV